MKALALAFAVCASACAEQATRVEFFTVDGQEFSFFERRTIRVIVEEVRALLPGLPARLTIRVQAGDHVIPETGETGSVIGPSSVLWSVDARRSEGVSAIAELQLRACLFHELAHLMRRNAMVRESILDDAVNEGLATAFERDYAGAAAPWGWYPEDAAQWLKKLRELPSGADAAASSWPRWFLHQTGTYVVDRAVRASGKPLPELVSLPTREILALADRS
jgi:hypothetical protein